MRKLFALIIGIDEYPPPVRPLKGCVNDAMAMDQFLQKFCQQRQWEYRPLLLLNSKAKRADIIRGYDIFTAAHDDDTCLVYYSGHGSRMKAAREFWMETDGMNETIVCWDARSGARDIIDKELAFLAWNAVQAKNVHFVEIMDCCFSGGNTRALPEADADDRFETPKYEGPPLDSYLGYDVKGAYRISDAGVAAPVSRKIHLSASKADETSKEKVIGEQRRGIFTWSLIQVLASQQGNVSYSELMDRTFFLVQQGVHELKSRFGGQSPQIDQHGVSPETQFLTGEVSAANALFLVGYDPEWGWIIKAGEVNGLPASFDLQVKIGGEDFRVKRVFPGFATLEIADGKFDKTAFYFAELSELTRNRIQVGWGNAIDDHTKTALQKAYDPALYPFFDWADEKDQQAYVIIAQKEGIALAQPPLTSPLFPPVDLQDPGDFLSKVNKVSKWKSTLDTDNPRSGRLRQQISYRVSVYQAGDTYQKDHWKDKEGKDAHHPVLYYAEQAGELRSPRFGLAIYNQSDRALWFHVLYLSSRYGIQTINEEAIEIPKGGTYVLRYGNDEKIPVSIDKAMLERYRVSEITDWVKVLWSTDPFDTRSYHQKGISFDSSASRDLGDESAPITSEPERDWGSFQIPLNVIYPGKRGELTGDEACQIGDHIFKSPAGFSAKVAITGTEEGTRATGVMLPSPLLSEGVSDFEINQSMGSTPSGNVIELSGIQGLELITPDQPLILQPGQPLPPDASLWVFGFDPESGQYYPVGFETAPDRVEIRTLPAPLDDQQRSVAGSVKLFLKKITFHKPRETSEGKAGDDRLLYRLAMAGYQPADEKTTYDADPERMKDKVKHSRRIMICMHGILGDTAHMVRSLFVAKKANGEALASDFDLILAFDYENLNTPIERLAEILKARMIECNIQRSEDREVVIMAHSMGGLVARYLIEHLDGDRLVSRLLQLGTPNAGAEWAHVAQLAGVLMTHVINFASLARPAQWMLEGLGKLLKGGQLNLMQMHPDSPFMKQLNTGGEPPVPYTLIAGDKRLVSTPAILSFWNRFLTKLGYGVADWLFEEANDIAVSRKNMIAGWGENIRIIDLACDHLHYFYDPLALATISAELSRKQLS